MDDATTAYAEFWFKALMSEFSLPRPTQTTVLAELKSIHKNRGHARELQDKAPAVLTLLYKL